MLFAVCGDYGCACSHKQIESRPRTAIRSQQAHDLWEQRRVSVQFRWAPVMHTEAYNDQYGMFTPTSKPQPRSPNLKAPTSKNQKPPVRCDSGRTASHAKPIKFFNAVRRWYITPQRITSIFPILIGALVVEVFTEPW